MRLAFIGVGHMGGAQAKNLLKHGFTLAVHDRRRAAAASLVALGAEWRDNPRAAVADADVVLSSLPGPREIEAVTLGEGGALDAMRAGSTWLEMSTGSIDLLKQLAAAAAQRGVTVIDAPVSGGVDCAETGRLAIFVGGAKEVVERHLAILRAMGQNIFHAGPLGAGLAAKLLTNLLWFIHAAAIGEGLMLGARAGIELGMLREIITSSCGNSWVAEHDIPSIYRGDYDPSFSLELCCKDLGLIQELGRRLGVPLEIGQPAAEMFQRAAARYGGGAPELSVVRLIEDALGTPLRGPGVNP